MSEGPTQALDYVNIPDTEPPTKKGPWGKLVSLNPDYPSVDLNETEVLLGRQSSCNIQIAEMSISGRHCRVTREVCEGSKVYFVEDLSSNGTFLNGEKIGQGKKMVIQPGAELTLLNKKKKIAYIFQEATDAEPRDDVCVFSPLHSFFFSFPPPLLIWHSQQCGLTKKYSIGDVLGTGNFAVVKFGVEKESGKKVAIKVIDKKRFIAQAASRRDKIMEEVTILQRLDHQNIIRIYDVFDTDKALYLVLELVTGGDLCDYITECKVIPEDRARRLFSQAVDAFAYLHGLGIVHRDLKVFHTHSLPRFPFIWFNTDASSTSQPENLLLLDRTYSVIKVSDFGLSKVIDEGSYTKVSRTLTQF